MEYIGIDVHQSESQISIVTEQGEILERRVRTRPDRFAEVLGDHPRARIRLMNRARVRTSASRTARSARTCRWASEVRCAGR